ncbi:MAG TPA: FtsX-like permease family protein [Bacteroidales bacterium]
MKRIITSMFRNIKRNPLFNFINLSGLALGFVCIIFITLWIKNELSYDRFQKNSETIYRIHRYFYDSNGTENLHIPYVAPTIAPLLKNEFPEIKNITRVYHTGIVFLSDNRKIEENNVCFAEPEVLKIFDFEGLPENGKLLDLPFSVIISDAAAYKYFHGSNAIGKILEFKDEKGGKHALQVAGTFKRWKQNSHFNPDFFISFCTLESLANPNELKDWSSNNYETFALIPYLPADFDKKLDTFIDKSLNNGTKWTKIRLEHLTDIHFNWYSSRSYIYILTSIALLILIMGSINYMNLNAAMYSKRIKEIKIKKIIGASQWKLTFHLLAESVLFSLIAFIAAVCIVSITLPEFNKIFNNPLPDFKIEENIGLISGFVILSVLTGLLSGIYPVLISSYRPAIKAEFTPQTTYFRNGLVVFQFIVSIVLIISFLSVSKQLNYIRNKELGLNKENVVVIPAMTLLIDKLDVFKKQLTQNPNILSVSASKRIPSEGLWDSSGAKIYSNGNLIPLGFRLANIRVDEQFIPTYKIQLAAGRNFNEKISTAHEYIINESAVGKMGWKTPKEAIGQIIEYGGRKGNVIGVVKDFHYESLHNPLSPIIMYYDPSDFNLVSIRITPFDRNKTLAFIEKTWQTYNTSDYSFSSWYVNDSYKQLYKAEDILKTLFSYFMILAISIAILGLVGLSVFIAEQRTKEIGIRKVNGARVTEILAMLNTNFIKWVIIAFVIASPIAWYFMHKWLQNFAYKTTLSWWVFVLAGIIAMAVAVLTVSWQSWKAATRNPVESLRYE